MSQPAGLSISSPSAILRLYSSAAVANRSSPWLAMNCGEKRLRRRNWMKPRRASSSSDLLQLTVGFASVHPGLSNFDVYDEAATALIVDCR